MDSRKRERELLEAMVEHAVGSFEYIIKETHHTPQEMWKLLPKFDSIPGLRKKAREMLKKHLPQQADKPKEVVPALKSKLSALSQ